MKGMMLSKEGATIIYDLFLIKILFIYVKESAFLPSQIIFENKSKLKMLNPCRSIVDIVDTL